MKKPSIAVKLWGKPQQLAMASRGAFDIGFSVENVGDATFDPKLDYCRLTVNGKPSRGWTTAVVNGSREKEWYALPPGHKLSRHWPLGTELFTAPGDYTLLLTVDGVTAAPLSVRVEK